MKVKSDWTASKKRTKKNMKKIVFSSQIQKKTIMKKNLRQTNTNRTQFFFLVIKVCKKLKKKMKFANPRNKPVCYQASLSK